MLFKRPIQRYGKTPEPVTPYEKAAQLWDERIGSSRVQARNWRFMALGCLTLAAGLSGGLVWQSMQSRVVPYVVEVDGFGEARAVAPAIRDYEPSDAQIAWHLGRFIQNVRSVSTDPVPATAAADSALCADQQVRGALMTDTSRSDAPPKLDPEQLQLRASPRRAVRFRRGVIVAIAAVGSGAILGVTMIALQGPAWRIKHQAEDRYNTERKPPAEGLEALPKDYTGIMPKAPVLGLPLPGDLGRPILERQRQLGIAPGQDISAEEQRLAQQAIEARESQVLSGSTIDPDRQMSPSAGRVRSSRLRRFRNPERRARQLPFPQPRVTRTTNSASSILSVSGTQAGPTIRRAADAGLTLPTDGRQRDCGQSRHRHKFRLAWPCRRTGHKRPS